MIEIEIRKSNHSGLMGIEKYIDMLNLHEVLYNHLFLAYVIFFCFHLALNRGGGKQRRWWFESWMNIEMSVILWNY